MKRLAGIAVGLLILVAFQLSCESTTGIDGDGIQLWVGSGIIDENPNVILYLNGSRCGEAAPVNELIPYEFVVVGNGDSISLSFNPNRIGPSLDGASGSGLVGTRSGDSIDVAGTFQSQCGRGTGTISIRSVIATPNTQNLHGAIQLDGRTAEMSFNLQRWQQ